MASRLSAEVFRRARLAEAVALALVDQGDVDNVNAALIAREVHPTVRIVVRLFNQILGEGVTTMLGDCGVLSGPEIAAPAFVATVLGDDHSAHIPFGTGFLAAVTRVDGEEITDDIVCGLAVASAGEDPEVLPEREDQADLVLTRTTAAAVRPRARRQPPPLSQVRQLLWGRRQRWAVVAVISPLALGSLVLAHTAGLSPWQAIYLALMTVAAGGNTDPQTAPLQQVTELLLVLGGLALLPW